MADKQPLEDRLIESLFARHAANGENVPTGPGDDAAVVRCPRGEDLVVTADTVNEGVHFPAGTPARSIGHRALAVSLSDLAAMGACPLWAVVALSAPVAEEGWLKDFADGLFSLADGYGVRVVGGDFVRGPLSVTVTAHGSSRHGAALRRDGASAGDGIWVSGFLGDAAAGLEALKQRLGERAPPRSSKTGTPSLSADALIHGFCYPQPRIELGRQLTGIASACMDLSDGLITDLPRLLRSSQLLGQVQAEKLPISGALRDFAERDDAYRLALAGGDDYELCFTVAPENEHRLNALCGELPLTRIGDLHRGEGLGLTRGGRAWEAPDTVFRHFS